MSYWENLGCTMLTPKLTGEPTRSPSSTDNVRLRLRQPRKSQLRTLSVHLFLSPASNSHERRTTPNCSLFTPMTPNRICHERKMLIQTPKNKPYTKNFRMYFPKNYRIHCRP